MNRLEELEFKIWKCLRKGDISLFLGEINDRQIKFCFRPRSRDFIIINRDMVIYFEMEYLFGKMEKIVDEKIEIIKGFLFDSKVKHTYISYKIKDYTFDEIKNAFDTNIRILDNYHEEAESDEYQEFLSDKIPILKKNKN